MICKIKSWHIHGSELGWNTYLWESDTLWVFFFYFVGSSVSSKWSFRNETLTSKISLMVMRKFHQYTLLPQYTHLFFIKNHMLLWSVGGFVSLLHRSEFLITNWGCVGAKSSLLSTAPPFAIVTREVWWHAEIPKWLSAQTISVNPNPWS